MQRRNGELPPTAFAAGRGHRSTVKGVRRFLAGRKKSHIADELHEHAKAILRRLRASSRGEPNE